MLRARHVALGATASIAVALALGFALPRAPVGQLEALAALPQADRASAPASPARYRGTLRGPANRTTPDGIPAAAYWWSVGDDDHESPRVYCTGRQRAELVLDTATGPMPITWTAASVDEVGLVSDERDREHGRRFMFDVGARSGITLDRVPPATCAGEDARYSRVLIEPGTAVEVIGCASHGAIAACDGEVGGVLATERLDNYLAHARVVATRPFRIALLACAAILVGVGYLSLAQRRSRTKTA